MPRDPSLGVDEEVSVEVEASVGAEEGFELGWAVVSLVRIDDGSMVGEGVGSLVGGRDGTDVGIEVGFLDGAFDGVRLGVTPEPGMEVALNRSHVHPQLLNPMLKSWTYDTVSGSRRTSSTARKYLVLIPSMNDRYGVLSPM